MGGAHHRVEQRPWPRLVLVEKDRVVERKKKSQLVDVVCLNEPGEIWKQNINYIERPGSAPLIRTIERLQGGAGELEAPVV